MQISPSEHEEMFCKLLNDDVNYLGSEELGHKAALADAYASDGTFTVHK